MKLAENLGVVERSDKFEEQSFRIAATAKAYEILSAKLYTDVPRAIIRELSTNASDAQVEVGNGKKPFEVHLPNWIEPFFQIRDYGSGLSPESVKEIYTVYFASTRSTSDDFTGCLGLGSKSPFSYTDSFTVTSYYKGVAYIYSLFKNEKGLPSITLMVQSPTQEPNGVDIKIAVKQHDTDAFCKAASKVYHYFDVKPNIKGGKITTFDTLKVDIEGDGYRISQANYNTGGVMVIMGQVCYNVNSINIGAYGFDGYNTCVEIYAKMGDCSFVASREELHMDDKTKKFIENKLCLAIEDMRKKMLAEMALVKTTLEGICTQNRYAARIQGLRGTVSLSGESIGNYKICRADVRTMRRSQKIRLHINYHAHNFNDARFDAVPVIIENDTGMPDLSVKMRSRMLYWIKNTPHNSYVCLAKIDNHAVFLKDFGQPIAKLSQLPDPPRAAGTPYSIERNKSCIRKLNIHSRIWENVEAFEEGDEIAIVHRDHNNIIFDGQKHNIDFLKRIMSFTNIQTVYGIPTRLYKKYDGDLKDIFTIAKNTIKERVSKLTDYEIASIQHDMPDSINSELIDKIKHINKVCEDFAKLKDARHEMGSGSEILSMANLFGIKMIDKPNFSSIFTAKYPLLTRLDYVPNHEMDKMAKEVEIYIKAKGV